MKTIKFTDIGLKIGHEQDLEAATGCTVILCEEGAVAGVDVRGGAPGTRETDLLDPSNLVEKVHAVLLTGGSAFGLDAAAGVMQYLEEKNIGFETAAAKVPIVVGAVLYDLQIGKHDVRPDKNMGYKACLNSEKAECPEGNVGAGTGATVGKLLGFEYAMKGGLGTYSIQFGDLKVGAVMAVNCLGDVIDPFEGNKIIAGALNKDKVTFADSAVRLLDLYSRGRLGFLNGGNTVIGVVATNAVLNKAQANRIASAAHDGLARTVCPSHTMVDGDTIFTLSTCKVNVDLNLLGYLAAHVVERAVVRAVKNADSLHGYKSFGDLNKSLNKEV
ncbi:MAG: Peptidase S58 DmpA [Clostridia bacterium 41_269]|nr:MAG: Peptidase S58 DmpA [Clostridia bacterium 41_269]